MPKENNKMQVDIENLFKQNVNDLLSIKELYKRIEELGEKITQIKYIDNTLVKKLKKEYENLKKIILNENVQVELNNKIEETKNVQVELNNKIEENKTELNEVSSQMDTNVQQIRINKATKNTTVKNVSLEYSKQKTDIYNLMQQYDTSSSYFVKSGVVFGDKIIIDNVELIKVTSSNFYNAVRTQLGCGINLIDGKKYLCSAYCITFGKPKYFYSIDGTISDIHHVHYCDNQLRRYWFIVDGRKDIYWYRQGTSGLNTESTNDIYLGGFQIEEITEQESKNGIIFIGDSTVDGASGNDLMNQNEWVKRVGALLNVKHWNKGIGGNRTQQMIDRWETDITPYTSECKYVVIQGGINDLSKSDTSFDLIKNNLQTMYDKGLADGLIPIMCTLTPCNKTGNDETIRNLVNEWIKTTFDKVLDLSSVVEDTLEKNKILQIDGWQGDNIHYGQKAKDEVANYIVSQQFWDLIVPSSYQKLENGKEVGGVKFTTGTNFLDFNNVSKFEISDFATGTIIRLKDTTTNYDAFMQFIYGTLTFGNNSNEGLKLINDGTVRVVKKLEIPTVQPSVIGDNAIWYDKTEKKYKCSAGGVIKTLAFE